MLVTNIDAIVSNAIDAVWFNMNKCYYFYAILFEFYSFSFE